MSSKHRGLYLERPKTPREQTDAVAVTAMSAQEQVPVFVCSYKRASLSHTENKANGGESKTGREEEARQDDLTQASSDLNCHLFSEKE